MRKMWLFLGLTVLVSCAVIPPYVWRDPSPDQEAEYTPYMENGTGSITGQAFLQRRDGMTVRAAGSVVTLDPATSIGKEWWERPVRYAHEYFDIPPSHAFRRARRCVRADADGDFRFENLPAGKYYIQTSVTWQPGGSWAGGMVGAMVEIRDGEMAEVALGPAAWRINRALLVYYAKTDANKFVPMRGQGAPACP